MPLPLRALLLLLLVFLAPTTLAATPTLSLPLGPHYRPGQYLPVRLTATLATPTLLTISDPDLPAARTTLTAPAGPLDLTLPLFAPTARLARLTLSSDPNLSAAPESPALKPLADTDRLVAWTVPDPAFARHLLGPAATIHPVGLDPTRPLPGHPAAWNALDLLLLDAATAPALTEPQLATLLAAGVTIAVRTPSPPFPAWPWKRDGDYHVLVPTPAGPKSAIYFDDAYTPVADWQPGHPWPVRRRILIVAALCCLPFLALALWRPRLTPLWTLLVTLALCLALFAWHRTLVAPRQATGEIVTLHPTRLTQTDRWTYQTTPAPTTATLPWHSLTHPVTSGDFPLTLVCDPAGQPTSLSATLPPDRKLAYFSRTFTLRAPTTPPITPVTSPLAPLALAAYTTSPTQLTGQLPTPSTDQWPAVIVDLRPPTVAPATSRPSSTSSSIGARP